MKTTNIRLLDENQINALSSNLFEYISLVYAIREPDEKFYSYFISYLKKYYAFMTFEQLESAFELNSLDHLNNFLQKIGQRPDNKVTSFSIPNLTKVINAYNSYKGIEKTDNTDIWNPKMKRKEPGGDKVLTEQEKHESMNRWVDRLCLIFEKYRDEFEKTTIAIPLFTCQILAKNGALDPKDIDLSERTISVKLLGNKENNNEDLIYKTFDKIIVDQKHIEDYLKHQRNKYSQKMPY